MLELNFLCHATTKAQKTAYFAGNPQLDCIISTPIKPKINYYDKIYCSNSLASIETAKAYLLEFTIDKNIPFANYGDWQGKSLKFIAKSESVNLQKWLKNPEFSPKNGLSFAEIYQQTEIYLKELSSKSGKILIICDVVFIRALYCFFDKISLSAAYHKEIKPCSLHQFYFLNN